MVSGCLRYIVYTLVCFLCFTFAVILVGTSTQTSFLHQVKRNREDVERHESQQNILKQGEMIGSAVDVDEMCKPANLKPPLNQ